MTYNERLFKLQEILGNGKDAGTLDFMYRILYRIALGLAPKYAGIGRGEHDSVSDIAHDAAAEIIRRYLETKNYQVRRCFKAVVRDALRNRCRPKRVMDRLTESVGSGEDVDVYAHAVLFGARVHDDDS